MPNLGSQFDNTYWENPSSGKVEHYKNPYSEREHAQGLLFHPGTGTQSYSDPMYSSEQRYEDIKKAIKPTIKGDLDERDAMGVIMDTKFTKSDFKNKPPAEVVIGSTAGIRTAAHYNSFWNRMHISESSALDLSGDRTAFAHEWGHKVDSDIAKVRTGSRDYPIEVNASIVRTNKRSRVVASPIGEGIADAFGERYGMTESDLDFEYAGHEDQFNPLKNPNRHYNLDTSGYRVKNSLWKDRQQQALYAATRIHVSMHGHAGIESLPNIEELAKTHLPNLRKSVAEKENDKWAQAYSKGSSYSRKKPEEVKEYSSAARHLYLGKLASEQPAVHAGLVQLGLGDVSKHAQTYYANVQRKTNNRTARQLPLPLINTNSAEMDSKIEAAEQKLQDYPEGPSLKKELIERQDLKAQRQALAAMERVRQDRDKRRSTSWDWI